MKNLFRTTILLIVFIPILSIGEWRDLNGHSIKDTAWMKSSGNFGAQLILVSNEKEFLKRWNTPTKGVKIPIVTGVNKGELLITPVLFAGCQTNQSGMCDVTGDFKLIRPDGTLYGKYCDIRIWKNKPPLPNGIFGLSEGYLKLTIEPEDPEGIYTVKVKVTDHIQKKSLVLTRTFSVPAKEETQSDDQIITEKKKALNQWTTYYYKIKHSDQDAENIKAMFQLGFFKNQTAIAPLIMFFAELFRQNETKLLSWEKTLHTIPKNDSSYILVALWQANTPNALKILNRWPDKSAAPIIKKIKAHPPLNLKTIPIDSPTVLDMLWSTFMASGNPIYVERIITRLASKKTKNKKEENLKNTIIIGAAKWSLTSNAFQHDLVLRTCQKFTKSNHPEIKKAMVEIVEKVKKRKEKE